MEENILTPGDYFAILSRRKWALIVPFIVIVIISTAVAFILPPVYRSTATILIEQREISAEYVTSSMTSYAEQRMQNIKQRVLTSRQLQVLIKKFNLYEKERNTKTTDEIIADMRNKIVLNPVNVEVADRKSGRTATATIAFTLSYQGKNPEKVQMVASTISTLFLKEDLKARTDQASSTHMFLKEEKEKIQKKLSEYERELAVFKEQNAHSLPELFHLNLQSLDNINNNIKLAKENFRTLKEKKEQLVEELSNTPKTLNDLMANQGRRNEDEQRLEILNMELIKLKTKFSDIYPDVKKLKREIKDLGASIAARKSGEEEKKQDGTETITNPAYITLSSRLAGLKFDIGSGNIQIHDLEKQAEIYRARLAETPMVEEKYNSLLTDKNNFTIKYNEMQAKMLEAKLAQGFESQQKGERFSLVEAAILPEKPFKPNRLAIVLIGFVLGIGAGVGIAAIMEFSDTSFRTRDSLEQITGFPVLTEIPIIITQQDKRRRLVRRYYGLVSTALAMVVLIFLFHNYVMDLDVLWTRIMRKIL